MGELPLQPDHPVRVGRTEAEVADAALRLLRLLDRPRSLAVLGRQLVRELHYWLLAGRHGGAIRVLGAADGHGRRIARAIEMLRAGYARPLRIETLAEAAGMSLSVFHTHFRTITTLTPLQFQKQLRLLEARRRMLAEGVAIGAAAHGVGYERSSASCVSTFPTSRRATAARCGRWARMRILKFLRAWLVS